MVKTMSQTVAETIEAADKRREFLISKDSKGIKA